MEKINLAELLKDCPSGMELDCTMWNNLYFDRVDNDLIHCYYELDGHRNTTMFCKNGCYTAHKLSKCVIFPKGKTTWEGFTPPCKFKDGNIVASTIPHIGIWVGIFKQYINNEFESYCFISANGVFNNIGLKTHSLVITRLASEEEQQKLFQAIKDNGYHWNAETKTLEKLVGLKFKVGDRIRRKGETSTYTITYVNDAHYFSGKYVICDTCEDDWELIPNKFDINTLKPFDKVLIRDTDTQNWFASLFSHCNGLYSHKYKCINGCCYAQCIPYQSNEYLLGTTEDCDEYYKNW